jgi:hypothetical protein
MLTPGLWQMAVGVLCRLLPHITSAASDAWPVLLVLSCVCVISMSASGRPTATAAAAAAITSIASSSMLTKRGGASSLLLTKRKRSTSTSGARRDGTSVRNEPHVTGSKTVTKEPAQTGSAHKKAKQLSTAAGATTPHAAAAAAHTQRKGDGAAADDVSSDELVDDEEDEDHMDEIYEISRILARKGRGRHTKYLIAWEGYTNEEDNSWEPVRNLINAEEALRDFEEDRRMRDIAEPGN